MTMMNVGRRKSYSGWPSYSNQLRGKVKHKSSIAIDAMAKFSKSPFLLSVWVGIMGFAWVLILGKHGHQLFIRSLGPLCSCIYVAFHIRKIKWDLLLIQTSFGLLIGRFTAATKVDDNLYLGTIPMKENNGDAMLSKKLGIHAIVSLLGRSPCSFESLAGTPVSTKEWKEVGIDDHLVISSSANNDLDSISIIEMHKAADFIDVRLTNNKRVFVHCRNGCGLGALAVLAYFMKHKRMGLREAFSALLRRRAPEFNLGSPWTAKLSKFEASFRGDGSGRGTGMHRPEQYRL